MKNDIDTASVVYRNYLNNIEILTTAMHNVTIINVYKSPNVKWDNSPVKLFDHPAVYIGDFNSHNSDWGYNQNDDNGEVLQYWIALNNLELIYNAKDMGTFRSARWRKDYTPDLSITSRNTLDGPTIVTRHILGDFPHSQHRPVFLEYGLKVPLIRSLPKPRWDFRKAKWVEYVNELDHVIQWIPPTVKCYERFIGAVKSAAYKHVPRGFRKHIIPGWDESCTELFEEF